MGVYYQWLTVVNHGSAHPRRPQELGGIAAYNHSCPTVTGADIMRQVGTEAQVTVWSQKQRKTPGCLGADYEALDLLLGPETSSLRGDSWGFQWD